MRRLRYHVAATVDGFIGHEDGSVDSKTSGGVALLRYRMGAGR